MHRLKVAMSGTSKSVSKIPPKPRWAFADAAFRQIEAPALEVEAALLETTQAWAIVSRSAGAFSEAMLKVPVTDSPGHLDDTFGELSAELDSQVADAGDSMMKGLEKVRESHSLLMRYCQKIRTLQEYRKIHEKAVTEAAYYSEKVEKVRDAQLKKKKSTEAELEKLKRNEEKLRACDIQVEETEMKFISGVEYLLRNKAIVFDRVLVGYIVGQSAIMDSNPFRGLSTSVQADFSTIFAAPLDMVDLEATTAETSSGLAGIPSPFLLTNSHPAEGPDGEERGTSTTHGETGFLIGSPTDQETNTFLDLPGEPVESLTRGGSVDLLQTSDIPDGAVLQPGTAEDEPDDSGVKAGSITSPVSVTE